MGQGVYEEWHIRKDSSDKIAKIRSESGFSSLPCRILEKRLSPAEDPGQWINPRLEDLLDPFDLPFCKEAASLVSDCLLREKKIAVFSDYDVDGITSAALISEAIHRLGGSIDPFLPDRMEEGYGLTRKALDRLLGERDVDCLLVLDCGTRSEEELFYLSQKGIQTIVIDHHARSDVPLLPDDCVLINPHLKDRLQPEFQNHCTAGLVFKFLHALTRVMHSRGVDARAQFNLRSCLDLVALGTVADLVPLKGENRLLVKYGLHEIGRSPRHGLKALLQVAGVEVDNPLSTSDIGFRLGPRINAGGRIETGMTSLDLLLATDHRLAFDLARKLDAVNRERQGIEKRVVDEARELVGESPPSGIVAARKEWHPGVVGIVAGRLARTYHRPTIILGFDGDEFKGSGRGIPGLNLLEVMESCEVRPRKWGGHPMAMGMSIDPAQLPAFSDAFAAAVDKVTEGDLPAKTLTVDTVADIGEIDRQCILELEAIGPFGQGNPEPVILFSETILAEAPRKMGKDHIKFRHPSNKSLEFIGWRMAENPPPAGCPVELAVRLSRSFWKGRESIRAEIVDWRIPRSNA